MIELARVVREKNLDHDYYHVFSLDPHMSSGSSIAELLELISNSVLLVRNACWEEGVPTSFYAVFAEAKFASRFPEGTDWRVVAWPFMQVASMLLIHTELDDSWPLLKSLGW